MSEIENDVEAVNGAALNVSAMSLILLGISVAGFIGAIIGTSRAACIAR